jgi:quinol monooxygenase YgiN
MSGYGMVGALKTTPEQRPALLGILTQAAALMNAVPSCQLYVVSEDLDDAGAVWVMELWDDRAAVDAVLARDDVRALIGQARPMLVEAPGGATLNPVAGKGLGT